MPARHTPPDSYHTSALILSVLLEDESEFEAAGEYLFELFDHTEAYREQASWCWLLNNREKLRP